MGFQQAYHCLTYVMIVEVMVKPKKNVKKLFLTYRKKKDITISMALIDYFRSYIDVDISEEIENTQKLIEHCKQKMYKITGIPKNIFNKEL